MDLLGGAPVLPFRDEPDAGSASQILKLQCPTSPCLKHDSSFTRRLHTRKREVNVLLRLNYPSQEAQFFSLLESKHRWIQGIVTHHLDLPSTNACRVADAQEWLHGSFNVCVPVIIFDRSVKQQVGNRVIVRFPLPYRIGEDFRPGNADEKVRCEAGTYAWLEQTCPDIPIPRLYGFAMSTGGFTRIEYLPFIASWFRRLTHRMLQFLGRPVPSRYVRHQNRSEPPECGQLNVGYLLIEYIDDTRGKMLSSTWALKKDDVKLRTNFFRDLSKIYLSLSKASLPRIGSFIINNAGFLLLKNRPLTLEIQDLENERVPTDIPRDYVYSTVDSFVTDVLSYHDNRLRYQPNAINDVDDYIYQTARLATMRMMTSSFFSRELRRGPFIYSLTDLHQSNIFVDDNWHITSLVDLEWSCSLPIEMIQPPHWLTGMAVDRIVSHEYNQVRLEFMSALATEEMSYLSRCSSRDPSSSLKLSRVMGTAWDRGTFWYSLALSSPTGLFAIFDKELQSRFIKKSPDHEAFHQIMPWYWEQDIASSLTRKLADREAYDIQLRREFEVDICSSRQVTGHWLAPLSPLLTHGTRIVLALSSAITGS